MAYSNPSVQDFKDRFARNFPFGGNDPMAPDLTKVSDQDIANGFVQTNSLINQALFSDQPSYTNGYLLLSASNLYNNLQLGAGGGGIGFSFPMTSKSVGSVSASYSIPERFMNNPYMLALAANPFGSQYLMLIYPYLTGAMFAVPGATNP